MEAAEPYGFNQLDDCVASCLLVAAHQHITFDLVILLQVHGTEDATVSYTTDGIQQGAEVSQATWADRNGCTGTLDAIGTGNYTTDTDEIDTDLFAYGGCPAGGAVQLWRMNDIGHIPIITDDWRRDVFEFFVNNPKP